jgi:hypothetical protein
VNANGFNYYAFGVPEWIAYGNTVVRGFLFNSRMQPTYIGNALNNTSQSMLSVLQLTWNANSTLQSESQYYANTPTLWGQLPPFTQSYSYDTLNRLQSASDSGAGRAVSATTGTATCG